MTNTPAETKLFRVKIGHAEVEVSCSSKQEAVRLARMKLGVEMPRLYDVIHCIDDRQFRVDEAHG